MTMAAVVSFEDIPTIPKTGGESDKEQDASDTFISVSLSLPLRLV